MKHLILANWKMSPTSVKDAQGLFQNIKQSLVKMRAVEVILAPPAVYIDALAKSYKGNKISLCAQCISIHEDTAHTGEISAPQYAGVGATYALIGHSESKDSLDDLRIKTFLSLKYKLIPVVFVGERDRDTSGKYLQTIREQIKSALKELSESQVKSVIFCYEPIWAIGRVEAMDTYGVHQMALYLRKVLVEEYGAAVARKAKILYGGSVNADNIAELLGIDDIDGVAVGRASTDAESFIELLSVANKA
jgi:triosephosphate isomerase